MAAGSELTAWAPTPAAEMKPAMSIAPMASSAGPNIRLVRIDCPFVRFDSMKSVSHRKEWQTLFHAPGRHCPGAVGGCRHGALEEIGQVEHGMRALDLDQVAIQPSIRIFERFEMNDRFGAGINPGD